MNERLPTKARIERAAIKLFARNRIEGTSTREITNLAETAEGSLYRHFSSKEELAQSLFTRHYLDLGAQIDRCLRGADSLDQGLSEAIAYAYRKVDHDPECCIFLILHQHRYLATIGDDAVTPVKAFKSAIEQAIQSGALPNQPADQATAWVIGLIVQPAVAVAYGDLKGPLLARAEPTAKAARAILHAA